MEKVASFPFFPLEMSKQGQVFDGEEVTALMQHVVNLTAPVDLLVLAHGWNNDMAEARELYTELLGNIGQISNKRVVVLGVFWPSKKFAETDLIPAVGVASIGETEKAASLKDRLTELHGTFDRNDEAELAILVNLVDRLNESAARAAYVATLRRLLPADVGNDTENDGATSFFGKDPEAIFAAVDLDVTLSGPQSGGGVSEGGGLLGGDPAESPVGGLAGGGSGFVSAASRLLNLTTYYQMKARAGLVGAGLNFVLAQISSKIPDVRIHLVGHSFGARLVTAAADGPKQFDPSSLTLLQGAFSHNGLTRMFDGTRNGVFYKVVDEGKVKGPICVTHTANDTAVGRTYALASRLAGDSLSDFGDENDRFGGIGRNGAVGLAANKAVSRTLPPAGVAIPLESGKVNNLRADDQIHNHSDIRNLAVAALVRTVLK